MNKNVNHPYTGKAKTIAVSVVIAIIAWAAIMWVDDPDITTTISDLDVRFVGEADLRENGLVITGKDDIPVMSVSVSGKRSDLMDYMDGIRIEVDSSQITEAGEYSLTGSIFLPSSRLTIEKEKNAEIPITVEKLETKEIEVRVKQTGTAKDKLISSVVENPTVTISGAKSEIDNVEYGMATVDISTINESGVGPTSYVLMDSDGTLISKNETIETEKAMVDVRNTVYSVRNLPVAVELSPELEEEYILNESETTVTPARVDVGVPEYSAQSEVRAILYTADESDSVECQLVPEEDMYIPEENLTVKVKAVLVKKVSKTLTLEVMAENMPQDKTVYIDYIQATVSGEESKLNTDNIKATVDLGNLDEGTYYLPVNISGDGVSVRETYYASVTIE